MKNNNNYHHVKRFVSIFIFIILVVNPIVGFVNGLSINNSDENSTNKPISIESSDVAGNEIYAEQISAFVAGGASLIRQSYVTNDTNIYKNFDYNDPGFVDCSLMISASNGISPRMFPAPVGSELFSSENLYSTEPLFGFLYYNTTTLSNVTLLSRAQRAVDVIEASFGLDLIMLDNQDNTNWYPFVAYYPDWSVIIPFITENTPQDGYWGAVDTDRLESEYYTSNYHISTTILMLNSMKYLIEGISLTEEYFDFDLRDIVFSFMEMEEISSLFDGLLGMAGAGGSVAGMGTFDVSSFLNNNEKVITTLLQYEGHPSGIVKEGNQYRFDLFKALNYDVSSNGALQPSEKIFIGLIGALLSGIDISIFSADIVSSTPTDFTLSDYLIETLEFALFLLEQDFDISMIENYSLGAFWENEGSVNRLTANIHNTKEPEDPVNLIRLLGIEGIPMIPTGILNPISEMKVNFAVNGSEPTITVHKDFQMQNLDTGSYKMNIKAENRGNNTVWGKDLSDIIDITELIPIPGGLEPFIQIIHPDLTIEEYLGLDENPRFFFIDTFGTGFYDTIYPNFLNLSALGDFDDFSDFDDLGDFDDFSIFDLINFDMLNLYAPQLVDDIIFFGLFGATEADREFYENLYANPDSIMNPDNWKLDPGDSFNYSTAALSLLPLYTFDDFYTFNFNYEDGIQPLLYRGNQEDATTANNGMVEDSSYWNVSSELIGNQYLTQIYFTFENDTVIDVVDNNIDRLRLDMSFIMNTTGYENLSISFYNYSIGDYGGFQEVDADDLSISNTSLVYDAFTNLTDYFDETTNYTSIFKISLQTTTPNLCSIDSLNLTISDRNLTIITENSARVSYSSKNGVNNYKTQSNSYEIATDHAPLLKITGRLEQQNSEPGEVSKVYVDIVNTGDRNATNVNLTMNLPAKKKSTGTFDRFVNGTIYWNVTTVEPGESVSLWFEFYTPNSMVLPTGILDYNSNPIIESSEPDFSISLNDLFVSAPIEYDWGNKQPFTDVVAISYTTNYTTADSCSGTAPQVGDHIEWNITISNTQTIKTSNFRVKLPKYFKGFEVVSSTNLEINNLMWGFPQQISVILNKTQKGAVLYPGIDRFEGGQAEIVQYEKPEPIILGYGCLNLTKAWNDHDSVFDRKIIVTINVTNTGNIIYENITVNDVWGFPKRGFYLFDGQIDHIIEELAPGESYSYSYTLKCKNQGTYEIKGAKIEYYYLTYQSSASNMVTVKVRNLWIVNAFWILIPVAACLFATIFMYWWKHRYDLEAAQFKRREELMFGQDLRSTAWDKFIIEEHLNSLMKGEKISKTRDREEVL